MKILLTSDWFIPAVNGVVVSFMNLYRELKKQGHDVRILTLSKSDDSYEDGDFYFVRSFGIKVYPDVRATFAFNSRILNELIDWKPDIIHSQCEFFTYTFAYRIAKKTGVPIVHTYHTLYEYYTQYVIPNKKLGKAMVSKIMRYRLKNAETVIAPTKKVKNTLLSYDLNDNLVIIPTGIDLSRYDKVVSQERKDEIRSSLNIPDDNKILINIGRVAEEKNLKELVDNFGMLLQVYDKVNFVIVGDGPYMSELKEYVQSKKLMGKIIFTGMINPDEVVDYYQTGDIFISASVSETQGLTYVEALANCLPEVCREDEAIDEVIENGYNGFTYKNEAEFIEYVKKLLSDDDMRAEFSKNARESSEKFSKENFGLSVYKVYEDTIKRFSPDKYKVDLQDMIKNIKIKSQRLINWNKDE